MGGAPGTRRAAGVGNLDRSQVFTGRYDDPQLPVNARRLHASVLLLALLIAQGAGFEASLCPPGMETGMDMGRASSTHCTVSTGVDDSGRTTCPFAVAGIGHCGTGAPVPTAATAVSIPLRASRAQPIEAPVGRPDHSISTPVPPPRA